MNENTEPIFGLDIGTSKCCAAAVDKAGWPRILADQAGHKIIPAVVSFHPDGQVLVGDEAKARRAIDPANTIASVARLVGQRASSREVVDAASRSSYVFRVGPEDQPLIATRAGDLSIPDVVSLLIDHMRRLAEAALDSDTRRCVLTVPAFYSQAQRQAVATAGTLAGIEVEGILEDPVAAAMAYGYSRATAPIVLVFDFGGGKFECSVLEAREETPRVLGTFGDTFLGGDDVDVRIADYTVRAFWQVHRVDLRADPATMPRLLEAAERAKWDLSAKQETQLTIPNIAVKDGRPLDLSLTVNREVFAQATDDLIRRTLTVCGQACSLAGLAPSQVNEVLLLGGMTKLPWLREQVAAFFGKQPRTDVNADVGVALGASLWGARQAGQIRRAGDTIPDAGPLKRRVTGQFGSDAQQAQPSAAVFGPTTPTPTSGSDAGESGAAPSGARVGRIATKKMFTAVMAAQPDTSVSFGETTPVKPQLIEVMASNLGISTVGGYCEDVIAREAPLPIEKTKVFSTGKDNQAVVKIRVCQGDSRRFDKNVPLGTIVLDGLPRRPRGKVKIAVKFVADAEGVLIASARDEETGRAQSVTIQLVEPPTASPTSAG